MSRQAAAANTTTVQDVVYRADGTPATGTLVISWPAFTAADNSAVAAGSMSVAIGAQGAISVTLVPNAGGTPDGTYYKVIYKLDDGSTSEESWSVPPVGTTTISNVRSKIVPSGVAMQVASRQYVDNAIAAALTGGHTSFLSIVTSFNGRTGNVMPAANDYVYSQLAGIPSSFNAGQLQGYNLDPPTTAGQQPSFNGIKFVQHAKQAADFRDFGANGDVLTDDTTSANSAIAALANNGGSLQLPGSTNFFWMRLTSPLNLSNTGNFKIGGAADSTGFIYCGDGSGPVLNANNTFNLSLRDLAIYGHWSANCTPTYATAGVAWDKTGTSAWNATRLMVNHVTITGAPQGDIGTPNFTCVDISPTSQVNVEDGKFYNISCIPGGIGFHIGPSANPKNEIFFNNNVTFGQYGYKFEGGGYHIKYGEVGNLAGSALWFSGANDPVSVDGLLSEANTQFLTLGPGFGHMPITLSHINNGWDDKATAPCFWDLGGAQYVLAFSNTWSDTSFPTPNAICGNSSSSGIFINNSFAWKVGGVNTGLYEMLPPPATIQQLLGPSYGFYQGGNIVLGSVNPQTDNGVTFIQSTGGTRLGLRILENPNPRSDGAIPVANDDPYLGEGVLEIAGPGAPTLLPGCTVTGGDTSQGYLFWMFAKDASGRRTTETHTFCSGPATPDSNHQMTFQWVGTPGSQSYDTMFLVNSQSCFIGTTTATSITVSAMPTCDNSYPQPTQNEAEYLNLRGKGVYGYGPSSAVTPTWSIDNTAGVASFSGGISAPNTAQLCTASNAQTCINAVSSTGGTVYLAAGTYTGAITLPDNGNCVNLVGAGIDLTVLTVSSSVTSVVSKSNSSLPLGCRITDLTIDGNLQATYGLQLQKGKGWQLQRVKIKRVLATTGEGIALGESSGSNAEFYDARILDVAIAFESGDYASTARPLNGLHFLATATDNQVSDISAWNMTNAGIVDDAGDNQYNKVHVYGFPLLSYYPNYAMEVLGNAHITQLTADGVATGGVHVRGNGNSVTNSTFQWPTGGQVSGAFPILADAGTDYNVYRDNVVRNGSGLEISGLAAVFAQIGNSYLPGSNTEISGNTNYGDSADGAFANFPVAGYYSFGQGSPRGAFTFISPFAASPTIVARLKASQTADFFDCLSADASTTLCSIDKNGNATFNSISGPLTGTVAAANGGTGASTVPSPAQIPIGNASGTAYVPQTVGGDCTISSSGSLTCTKTNGTAFAAAATLGASGNASKAATTNVANDTSGQAACWDGSHNLTNNGCSGGGSGSGTVNSGTAGQIAYYASNGTTVSGQTTIPSTAMPALAGDLSSSAGSNAVTVAKVNGVSYPSGPPANTVPVVTTSNTVTYETLPVAAGGTGATTLSANALLKGNGASSVSASALSDNGTILSASESLDLQSNALVMETANNSTTAPVLNQLVKLTGAPSTATVATTSDTTGIAGICIGNCATAGNALIAREGQAACIFDGATVAGDWVQVSTTTGGDCHDTGSATYPTGGGQVLGRVLSTNASGGMYSMTLLPPGIIAPATASATLTAGKLLTGNGGSAITTGNLSGDVTTSGSTATTVVQINGGSIPVSANFVGTNASGQLVSQAAALRVAATSLTAQTASISNTTLYTPSSAGTYRVSLAMWTMTAGSSGTVSFSLSAGTGSGAESFGSSSLSLATVNSGGQVSGQWNIHVGASQAISYNTTLTCSSCGSPQYGIDVVVERLQ